MPVIAHQKQEVRQAIGRTLAHYMTQHPEAVYTMAVSLAAQLAARMTLAELRKWRCQLAAKND